MGGISRIKNVLKEGLENRFLILYGPGINDVFLNNNGKELNFEQALYETLRDEGYERILFFSPHRALYVYDHRSLELINSSENTRPPSVEFGPLHNYQAITPSNQGLEHRKGIGDFHSLKIIDSIIKDNSPINSVVIFLYAETLVNFFEDKRSIAGFIGDWASLGSEYKNKCIFTFSFDIYEKLNHYSENLYLPELRIIIQRNKKSVQNISFPEKDELDKALRTIKQKNIIEKEREKLVRILQEEHKLLRYWLREFKNLDGNLSEINLRIARKQGWISSTRYFDQSAYDKLMNMVGMAHIKKRVDELIAWSKIHDNPDKNFENFPILHMIFSGNPGTGKTTVARLLGEIFHDFGWLKKGHLIEVQANDLVAQFVGGTSAKVNSIIDQALDGILFIDEAYSLVEEGRGGFGFEALETLLSRMESDRHRFVVICAGYREKMDKFRRSNPGLTRRFPHDNIISFDDYDENQLFEILIKMLSAKGLNLDKEFEKNLRLIIHEMVNKKEINFGNAGEMRNFADSLEKNHAVRIYNRKLDFTSPLTHEDLSDYYRSYSIHRSKKANNYAWQNELNSLVGMINVKNEIYQLSYRLEYELLRVKAGLQKAEELNLKHFVFIGNPGTGKTTVARLIGSVYKEAGLLTRGHLVEVTRADLVAGYVGQTALKTREVILNALGGVLFIDEAYSLYRKEDDFGKEAIEELIKQMEDRRNQFVVIAAGYSDLMSNFLSSNPGIASRFAEPTLFEDFTENELWEIMQRRIELDKYTYEDQFKEKVLIYLEWLKLRDGKAFGNGRSVRELFENIKTNAASRIIKKTSETGIQPSSEELSLLLIEDIPEPGFYLDMSPVATTEAIAKSRL